MAGVHKLRPLIKRYAAVHMIFKKKVRAAAYVFNCMLCTGT